MDNMQRVYTEVMVEGDCWHVVHPQDAGTCNKCKVTTHNGTGYWTSITNKRPDLAKPAGAFWLLQRLPKWDRFEEFILFLKDRHGWYGSPTERVIREILPWLALDAKEDKAPALYNALCEFMGLEVKG